METLTAKDRQIIRSIASRQLEYANSIQNKQIVKRFRSLAKGEKDTPTVRLLFSNFPHEVIEPRLQCESPKARALEACLLGGLVGRELFNDDTPIPPYHTISLNTYVNPFGISPTIEHSKTKNSNAFHIEPVITDLSQSIESLKGGSFSVDIQGTQLEKEFAEDVFGDILPVNISMSSLCGAMTSPLVYLLGMENYYCSMYDCPEQLHEAMDMACSVYEQYYDYLEDNKLLFPTNDFNSLGQESFCFTEELPTDNVTKTTQCWGFLESQETTAVSADTFGEFVFPYQDRLVKRFGLLSYGCCERVDAIFLQYLSKWDKLRKLSVSPFNNKAQIGEFLRGSNTIYYSKPRAEYVTNSGPMDEEAVRECFKQISIAASGCLLEVAQREVGTIFSDFNRGKRYVELAKQSIETYWKP